VKKIVEILLSTALLSLGLAQSASAQLSLQFINCYPNTPCTTTSGPGVGTGDPSWLMAGKINADLLAIQALFATNIPGTPTDAYLIANYPASSFNGYTANTSDMGTEVSNGVEWLIGTVPGGLPPVPPGAAALGYTKLLFAFHPTVATLNVLGNGAAGAYKLYGSPGNGGTQSSAFFTTTNGQFTLVNSTGSNTNYPAVEEVTTNTTSLATMQGALPMIPVSTTAGYYVEYAYHISNTSLDHWEAVWIWTAEKNTSATTKWVEMDVNEGVGASLNNGMWATDHYWNGATNTQDYTLSQLYNGAALDRTQEHIYGQSMDPVGQNFQRWLDGSYTGVWGSFDGTPPGQTTFSKISLPTAAYNGFHHYITFQANSRGGGIGYSMMVRYAAVWVHP